jgi:hypothetical protein
MYRQVLEGVNPPSVNIGLQEQMPAREDFARRWMEQETRLLLIGVAIVYVMMCLALVLTYCFMSRLYCLIVNFFLRL